MSFLSKLNPFKAAKSVFKSITNLVTGGLSSLLGGYDVNVGDQAALYQQALADQKAQEEKDAKAAKEKSMKNMEAEAERLRRVRAQRRSLLDRNATDQAVL